MDGRGLVGAGGRAGPMVDYAGHGFLSPISRGRCVRGPPLPPAEGGEPHAAIRAKPSQWETKAVEIRADLFTELA